MNHLLPHPLRGRTVPLIRHDDLVEFMVEDWWDRISPRADRRDLVYGHLGPHDGPQLAALVCNQELGWRPAT